MIVQESGSSQEVVFVARELATGSATAKFTDEQTNEEFSYAVTLVTDRDYTTFDAILSDLKEDRNYMVEVTYSGNIIYLGKAYCTNQTAESYTIESGQYTQPAEIDNEYIVYEP